MIEKKPRLSVGLPVFNGEKYLRQAIESVLNQTYSDFELIISDNASTDRTQEICRDYLKKDNRIRYYRSARNHGLAWNWNHVVELSSGVYFKWVAHDDTMAPQFLTRCINELEKDPRIALCHSKNAMINETDAVIGKYDLENIIDSQKPHERFREMMNKKGHPWLIFGVFRLDALRMTRLYIGHIGSDWNLLAEIALIGRIVEIPEYLFFRRHHAQAYTNRHYSKRVRIHDYRTESLWWTGHTKRPIIVLPHWRIYLEFFKSVRRSHLTWLERYFCYREATKWFLDKGKGFMRWDVTNEFELWWSRLSDS